MKEKIRQLAKEQFTYEQPSLRITEDVVSFEVEAGSLYMGSITFSNSDETALKGIVYSSMQGFKILNPMFTGVKNEIRFSFDAKNEVAGSKRNGKIYLVTNCFEESLPVKVSIIAPYVRTSLGVVKDLFHFANLASVHFEEARKLFESADFERVFLKDSVVKNYYHCLMESKNHDMALEEFLITIQKKTKIHTSVSTNFLSYDDVSQDFMEYITIRKDNWGYEGYRVLVDGDFVSVEKPWFSTYDFVGKEYELPILIERNRLRRGKNFARISLQSSLDTIEIDIVASFSGEIQGKEIKRDQKEAVLFFTQTYLNFRTGQIAYDTYINELKDFVHQGSKGFTHIQQKVLDLYLCIMEHHPRADALFFDMEKNVSSIQEESLTCYAAYLYLKALYTKNAQYREDATEYIRAFCENGFDSWPLSWFLFYLDGRYEKEPELKYAELANIIERGNYSPILYYEAIICLKEQKEARTYFGKNLLLILAYGIRMKCLTKELEDLFCFLCEQEENFPIWMKKALFSLYEQTKSKEALYTICQRFIQIKCTDSACFPWFQLGIKEGIKLTNLYEYYIYTMPFSHGEKLPSSLLLFFQYDNQLSFEKKAFFYAYLVTNKRKDMAAYEAYEKKMRKFALEALKAEKIDSNLGILYQEFFLLEDMDERLALAFLKIMFRQELICEHEKIMGVYVSHKEIAKEVYIPLVEGRCYLDIYTENPCIALVDAKGNRYISRVSYQKKPMFHIKGLASKCYAYCKNNNMLLLYLFEKIFKYQTRNEDAIYIQRRCVLYPSLLPEYKGFCYENLIQYYYDKLENETLKEMLLLADFSLLAPDFRKKAIYYSMIHSLSQKASFALKEYGFEQIPINRLIQFCSEEIKRKGEDVKDSFLLSMAYYIFRDGKYNETILTYLMRYWEGDTDTLLRLWKSGINFDLEPGQLEERIISQVLFCENQVLRAKEVFLSFYKKRQNTTLVRAYLSYTSYRYLLNERLACEELFPIMLGEAFYKDSVIGTLALLSYYSKQETISKKALLFCEEAIYRMSKQGKIFPFYYDFHEKIKLPKDVTMYHYVVYHSNPKHNVRIHYMLEEGKVKNQKEYQEADMISIYQGIFIFPFLIFKDEALLYYISEDSGSQTYITESGRINGDREIGLVEDSQFGILNLILTARELNDDKTMLTFMEQYIQNRWIQEQMFPIL